MKEGRDALDQYAELAAALRQIGAGWVVDEVEDVIARGKTVPFRDLPRDEQRQYMIRLDEEARRGLSVGSAKANDEVGTAYRPDERLTLLVDAADRVIGVSLRSHAYINQFALHYGLRSLSLEEPAGQDAEASTEVRRDIPIDVPVDAPERLAVLDRVLRDEVLE